MVCDRCGCEKHYITLNGSNGMIAWQADLCRSCYEDVLAMMLNQVNRRKGMEE